MYPTTGYCLVQNQIIASRWMHMNYYVGYQTTVCTSSLKLNGIVKGMIDDNCVLDFFNHTTHLFNGP